MQTILKFLADLKQNNNREWFAENKATYLATKQVFDEILVELIAKVNEFDIQVGFQEPKNCTYRIYRDARFSKDKTPYKPNYGGFIARGGRKSGYAGYYLHIEPDNSFLAGGVYCPQPAVLKEIRYEIYDDATKLRNIISEAGYKKYFDGIWGDKLKTAPRGFPKDFKAVDLLQFKSYNVVHNVDNEFLMNEKFIDKTSDIFRAMLPFNKYFNQIIEPIL